MKSVNHRLGLALLAASASIAVAAAVAAEPTPIVTAPIVAALADPRRPASDRADDALRDPAETLAFAGVRSGMTVAELFPGGGYYTRLLADLVGPEGKIIGLENEGWKESVEADRALVNEPGRGNIGLDVEPFGQFKLLGKVDLFWITQNYHDLYIAKYGIVDVADFNRRVFEALKPGGVYFILDHEAPSGVSVADIGRLHRIEKARVIAEVTAAGFRFAGEGRFLNRPGDDHTRSIFDPAIRGHTDQYALRFVRP